MTVGASEAETFWTAFLRTLARRGLRGARDRGLATAAVRSDRRGSDLS